MSVLITPFAAHSNLLYLCSGVDGPRSRSRRFRRLAWIKYKIKQAGTLANIFLFKNDRNPMCRLYVLPVLPVGTWRVRLTACLAGDVITAEKNFDENNPKTRWSLKTGKTNISAPLAASSPMRSARWIEISLRRYCARRVRNRCRT